MDETGLTRKAIIAILTGIEPLVFNQFRENPEEFIIKAAALINDEKATAIIQHITYNVLDDCYDTDVFTEPTLKGHLGTNAMKADKHLYDHILYDSTNERDFATELDIRSEVAVYVKLPNGFYISTPVGRYNPDWAIAFYEGMVKHIYFVAETKGSMRSILFRFNRSALKVFLQTPELVIPYLQRQFYVVRRQELTEERAQLEKKLEQYAFDEKMAELTEKSLRLFQAELSEKFHWKEPRQCFEMRDFRGKSKEFNQEYPVILSTTYSIKGTLNFEHAYDYLIVDEASQVDLATGVLALASAKNIVIVGDLQQLPNVLDSQNIQKSEEIWEQYSFPETYHFTAHSLLSSAIATWPEAPTVLLREHYRCHPKIINFCNQKFYGGKLIVMTEDHEEPNVLTMYRTAPGNHARGHLNQRQIDVIRQEVLPSLERQEYRSIGIITPYRDQVAAIQTQLGKELEVATVHKFQGREKDAIVLTSVDNVITDFVDDPRMLNVAVSRAVKSLTVITSQDPQNDRTNYGDLARYIEYNNCTVIESAVYSVFDLLYRGYAEQRRALLKKHGKVSEYDSENLAYAVIQNILQKAEFSFVDCAAHVALVNLVKDYSMLTEEETTYARNPLTHVDFLLFRRMDKSPLLAVEVDGAAFHAARSVQANRDEKKNRIFEQCGIPLLRLRTDGSGEEERIEQALRSAVSNS